MSGSLNIQNPPVNIRPKTDSPLRGTLKGEDVDLAAWDEPNVGPRKSSPQVQAPVDQETDRQDIPAAPFKKPADMMNKTINPYGKKTIKLIRLAPDGQETQVIELSETEVVLNRSNLDPGNNSLSGSSHAILKYSGGTWHLSDTSSFNNTFIYAGKDYPLKNGDIILLGDCKFKVDF
jgi:hypothetical protein